jgi:hypothetical protein
VRGRDGRLGLGGWNVVALRGRGVSVVWCSTYERYVAEVNSGQLRWGIVHTEKFWRENVRALEAKDFQTLK